MMGRKEYRKITKWEVALHGGGDFFNWRGVAGGGGGVKLSAQYVITKKIICSLKRLLLLYGEIHILFACTCLHLISKRSLYLNSCWLKNDLSSRPG